MQTFCANCYLVYDVNHSVRYFPVRVINHSVVHHYSTCVNQHSLRTPLNSCFNFFE